MSYIDVLADEIRRRIPSSLIPAGDTDMLFRLYAVLARAKGEEVSAQDVHDAWSAWMSPQNPQHPALRPHEELTADIRSSDQPYVEAIRAVARARAESPRRRS